MLKLTAPPSTAFLWQGPPPRWLLKEGARGQPAIPLSPTPFQIGRSLDCDLTLPHSEPLARDTSRWHCHVTERGGRYYLHDGSLNPVPETGQPKPSITGTFLNGKKVSGAQQLKVGDTIAVGPWKFNLEGHKAEAVDIDRLLEKIKDDSTQTIVQGDPGLAEGFGQLQELFTLLNQTQEAEESLTAVLSFALEKIKAAEVAALIVYGPDGVPTARLAWQRRTGRVFDLRFSSGLLRNLPADRAFLLKTRISGDITQSQVEHNISSALLVPLLGSKGRQGMLYLDNRHTGLSFHEKDLYLANALANVASLHLALERQAFLARVEDNMKQYFGPDVVRLIVEESAHGRPVALGVRECTATVLFVDMQDFSAFCRQRTPQEISELLNPFFELAASSIQRHGGHVDKFIGDCVMGVFGAQPLQPSTQTPNHTLQAFRAARELLSEWNKRSMSRWGQPIPLRAGINTGKVVIGNIGSPDRMEYSVLGDTVNLASRLEAQALPGGIALSDSARAALGTEVECRDGGQVEIKGLGQVRVWRADAS